MEGFLHFDEFRICVYLPEGTPDDVTNDARAALDDAFLGGLQEAVRRCFAADPALAVLSVSVEP